MKFAITLSIIIMFGYGIYVLDEHDKARFKKEQLSHQLWEESNVSVISTKNFPNCISGTLKHYDPTQNHPDIYSVIRCPNSDVTIEHDCGKNCTQRMTTSSK